MNSSVKREQALPEVRMHQVQSPPLAGKEWPAGEETRSSKATPDQRGRSEPGFGKRSVDATVHPLRQPSVRPSIGRRMFRGSWRFSVAVLIGVGATLGWQSWGDAAREMLLTRAPALATLMPVSVKPPAVAAAAPDPMQQLGPMAFNLDALRRSVEQLSARQDQMAQNIAALQAVGDDIKQKVSAPPPAPAQPVAAVPQRRPPQPRAPSTAVPRSPPPAAAAAPSR
jgi:hypothetical protein